MDLFLGSTQHVKSFQAQYDVRYGFFERQFASSPIHEPITENRSGNETDSQYPLNSYHFPEREVEEVNGRYFNTEYEPF